MPVALLLFALLFAFAAAGSADAPAYSAASIVNAADNETPSLAPNVIATIYGTGLAYVTRAMGPDDIHGGTLPTVLSGTGVRVIVGGIIANIYYVSPTQINFLVPASLLPAQSNVQVVLDSTSGPLIPIQIAASSPALFQLDAQNAIATRPDGTLLTPNAPANPGDIVILYATGLGQTVPPAVYAQVATQAAFLKQFADFQIMLDGSAIDPIDILYAGLAPGFAGLYQINLIVPAATGPNPEIRIGFTGTLSKSGLRLPLQ
jgi:uncharacterized protein (TIGR03437 family)